MSGPFNERAVIHQSEVECAMVPGGGVLNGMDLLPVFNRRMLDRAETILLVEDEAFVREVTVEVLKSAGYLVLIAKNAAEARSLYDHFSSEVDLLLTDVVLPDENGRTLARELRSQNAYLATLLVTGYAEQVEITESEPAGLECLPKPFSSRTLLQKVRTVLEETASADWRPVTRACGSE